MNQFILIGFLVGFLMLFFGLAYWAEKHPSHKLVKGSMIYSLSLGVYCTAWTYYGSIGVAARSSFDFLTIYIGPLIAMPLWLIVVRKAVRITKQHNISSIADFISLRHGNSRFLGALVTFICFIAVIPYIALQLKAVSETFEIMMQQNVSSSSFGFGDYTFYIALLLAIFAALFGTQLVDASKYRRGIVFSIAIDSLVKLFFFSVVGIYVVYYLFEGTTDLFQRTYANSTDFTTIANKDSNIKFNWFLMNMLSFFSIFLLPRQFHVSVVENKKEKNIKKAVWFFPLYLLLFNVFVVFIAWAGNILLPNTINTDYYLLLIPLQQGHYILATLVFLGGFSAVISMVVVSTLALSIMLSNNVIIPYGYIDAFNKRDSKENAVYIKNIRRLSIFLLVILAYFFYSSFSFKLSLYSIGLVSFTLIAQLAPSFFLGLFWIRGNKLGAKIGIISGFLVVLYTLVIPFLIESQIIPHFNFIKSGLFGINFLKPYALFGAEFDNPITHSFYWSILVNTICYCFFSLYFKGNYRERNYAEIFVNSIHATHEDNYVWRGNALVEDLKKLLTRFLGDKRTNYELNNLYGKYNISKNLKQADAKFISMSEKLLTGSLGSASAKILISTVTKEQPISLKEVLEILEENKKNLLENKLLQKQSLELTEVSNDLKALNNELRDRDRQKDEFLNTVAHELKTPITAIRSAAEILKEDQDISEKMKNNFLNSIVLESKRLTRLIQNILTLERLTSERDVLNLKPHSMRSVIAQSVNVLEPVARSKKIKIKIEMLYEGTFYIDKDKILQLLNNLISNAIKFIDHNQGLIVVRTKMFKRSIYIEIEDNGIGIHSVDVKYIFDKFYQSKFQDSRKKIGSGFGLAICKQIVKKHSGDIRFDEKYKNGSKFVVKLPLKKI